MSRKDFVLIASTINDLDIAPELRLEIAEQFATKLAKSNERFNRQRFIDAAIREF